MATVGKRWVRANCPICAKKRNFTIDVTWRITCPKCGHERELTERTPARPELALSEAVGT